MRVTRLLVPFLILAPGCDRAPTRSDAPLPVGALELRDVGFETPESALHDEVADVYLVSNINGGAGDRDDNGFISRVSPEGELLELKWIDGEDEAVRLSAPKGMAIVGDRLLVTDIDTIRVFDRATGAPLASWGIAGATSLNDLSAAPNGYVYVSDMGPGSNAASDGAFAGIHRVDADGIATVIARGDSLMKPNGVAAAENGVVAVSFRGARIFRVDGTGRVSDIATLPGTRNDGLVSLPGGDWLVSSWDARAVLRVRADGEVLPVVEDIGTPADIGYDARRNRLLVPSFDGGWLRIYPLE